ncbi:MAG: hypothetical protein FD167_1543, partial [bacterium]
MEDNREEQIIRLALAKGLVSEQDLEQFNENANNHKSITAQGQLDELIEAGLLSKAMWRALEEEVEARKKSPAFQLPFTIGQDLLAFTSSKGFKVEVDKEAVETDLSITMKSNTTISRELRL